jgi:ApaG protein
MIKIEPLVSYIAEESDPTHNHYFFAYRIKITNESDQTAQLISRHWVIMNSRGQTKEVKGEGVVGQQPILKPGESFEYTSYCPLDTALGSMRGSFEMRNDSGQNFTAEIPEFDLIQPGALGLMN